MTFGKIIRSARENMDLSQEAAAKMIREKYGVRLSSAYLSMIERGERVNLTTKLNAAIRDFYKIPSVISYDEFERQWDETQTDSLIKELYEIGTKKFEEKYSFDIVQKVLLRINDQSFQNTPTKINNPSSKLIPIDALPVKSENLHMIPVVGKVSAGDGVYAEEDIEEYWPIDISITNIYGNDLSQYFYLRVKGDSMEPLINDGDLVLVWKGPIEDGDVAVVIVNGSEGCVKKVEYHMIEGKYFITLYSRNPHYPPKTHPAEECYITGKVVWRSGDVKW